MASQLSNKKGRKRVTAGSDQTRKRLNRAQDGKNKPSVRISGKKWLLMLAVLLFSLLASYLVVYQFAAFNSIKTKPASEELENPAARENSKKNTEKASERQGTDQRMGSEIHRNEKILADNFKSTVHNVLLPTSVTLNGKKLKLEEVAHSNKKSSVRVYVVDNFLSERECKGLSDAHFNHVRETSKQHPIVCFSDPDTMSKHLREIGYRMKAAMSDFTDGTLCVNRTFSQKIAHRFSYSHSTAFYRSESKFALRFEELVAAVTGLSRNHGGKFQITSYQSGVGYKNHTDCNEDTEVRDRFATVLVYLKDVEKGGETKFPKLGISIKPKRGRLLFWNNMRKDGLCDPTSIHNAAKVDIGHKVIIQRWYYYKNFYSLGKRPPEPSLPKREEFQPRVSCDEFEHGSCRWYDEWGYDHLLNYQLSKRNLL